MSTYPDNPGSMLWRILSSMDTAVAALDATPFQRNNYSGDLAWTRSLQPLSPDLATPRTHLQYIMAFRSHAPSGKSYANRQVQMVANVDLAFAFLAVHNDQWESYRSAMQAAHLVRNTLLKDSWHCTAGLGPVTVRCTESFNPSATPTGTAGLVISQNYLVTHLEELSR